MRFSRCEKQNRVPRPALLSRAGGFVEARGTNRKVKLLFWFDCYPDENRVPRHNC